jgi:hypothetical protein
MKIPVEIFNVVECASDDTTRPNLGCVCLEVGSQGRVRVAATNGHCMLVIQPTALLDPGFKPGRWLLPSEPLKEAIKKAAKAKIYEIGVEIVGTKVLFEVGTSETAAPLVDGSFPDYLQVLPSEIGHVVPFFSFGTPLLDKVYKTRKKATGDDRPLALLATAADGTGPGIEALNLVNMYSVAIVMPMRAEPIALRIAETLDVLGKLGKTAQAVVPAPSEEQGVQP